VRPRTRLRAIANDIGENKYTWKIVKKPKPIQTNSMTGASQNILADEVHPNMKSPAAKKTDPTIIGGRRASGTAFLPLTLNFLI
jgi:hypothetical protein